MAENFMRLVRSGLASILAEMATGVRADGQASAASLRVQSGWTPATEVSETANDSDKLFTVPVATEWHLFAIHVILISTASPGNRQIAIVVADDSANPIFELAVGAVQADTLTRTYTLAPGLPDLTAFRATDELLTPLPGSLILPAGYTVRVYDSAAIDAAADDMSVYIHHGERAA